MGRDQRSDRDGGGRADRGGPARARAARTDRLSLPVKAGAFELRRTGLDRFDWRDPYHIALSISWPRFFAVMLGLELCLNSGFACLYLLQRGDIANARPGSFTDAFFFSLETLATVGYGVMAPATLYGHIVSALEILTGVTFTALLTGAVFGRFSRPRAKILYADHPVICLHGGRPALMVRIANGRRTLMVDAEARIAGLLMETTLEGQRFRTPHDLKLARASFPLFALTWTLIHYLDGDSPLAGWTPERFAAQEVRMFVSVSARDVTLAAQVQDIQTYHHESILFGMRYADAVSWDRSGRTLADLTKLSAVLPDQDDIAPAETRAGTSLPVDKRG